MNVSNTLANTLNLLPTPHQNEKKPKNPNRVALY